MSGDVSRKHACYENQCELPLLLTGIVASPESRDAEGCRLCQRAVVHLPIFCQSSCWSDLISTLGSYRIFVPLRQSHHLRGLLPCVRTQPLVASRRSRKMSCKLSSSLLAPALSMSALRRSRTAVSSVCLVSAGRTIIRCLLWCEHASHLQRSTREHFEQNVLESTEESAVPAEVVDAKTAVEEPLVVHGVNVPAGRKSSMRKWRK